MKKYRKVEKDQLFDIVCDVCGKRCRDECSDAVDDAGLVEYATLEAFWGYCSNKDGERYTCEMCEVCFDRVRAYIDSLK